MLPGKAGNSLLPCLHIMNSRVISHLLSLSDYLHWLRLRHGVPHLHEV